MFASIERRRKRKLKIGWVGIEGRKAESRKGWGKEDEFDQNSLHEILKELIKILFFKSPVTALVI